MAPHAEETVNGHDAMSSTGHTETAGDAPLEPGVKKNIAQGKMISFPSYVPRSKL